MRILQTIASTDPKSGGPVEVVRQFAPHAAALGHTVDVLSLDAPESPWLSNLPFKTFACGPGRGTFGQSSAFKDWLTAHVKEYDVVVANGIWQFPTYATRISAKAAGVPYVVFVHGMLDPWFKKAYPLKHLKKVVYWRLVEAANLKFANAVAYTCEEERRLGRASFSPYAANEVIIPLGTSGPPKPAAELESAFWKQISAGPEGRALNSDTSRFILFLGRLHEKKGPELLLQAFRTVAPAGCHLVYVGPDNGMEARLKRMAAEFKIEDRVHWLGMLEGDAKWGAYVAADAFSLPSHQENFGISVAEALACGCPVLLSDKVNIWREIAADHAGFVGGDDLTGTEQTLRQWFEASAETRVVMRPNAVECFEKHFESGAAAKSYLATLEAVIRP